jgi:DNA ligase-associated metallophosphoesterase
MRITIKNNAFTLLPQKAIWWKEEKTILISDLHIGKIAHFRKAGIAVPPKAAEQNFRQLDELMNSYPVQRIVFVGDLFHSDLNSEWDLFCSWRNRYTAVEMLLILGNHDRFPVKQYQDICLEVHEQEWRIGPFTFAHHPKEEIEENEYVISGHIHPVVKLTGIANQQLKFPCFYFGARQAILPSFGSFTGGYVIDIKQGDQVVAVVEEKLIKIK